MKNIFKGIIFLMLFVSFGCATAPVTPQKSFIDQAIWNQTTKDKVYSACLTALTMANIAVHPLGLNKESGIIVTKPRGRHIEFAGVTTFWHYTLQISVFENQDNKVVVAVTAADCGYNGLPPKPEYTDMRRYFNESVADDVEIFFSRLDSLLGKAEYYSPGKVLFPL